MSDDTKPRIERIKEHLSDPNYKFTYASHKALGAIQWLLDERDRLQSALDATTQPPPDVAEVVALLNALGASLGGSSDAAICARAADTLTRVAAERDAAVAREKRSKAAYQAGLEKFSSLVVDVQSSHGEFREKLGVELADKTATAFDLLVESSGVQVLAAQLAQAEVDTQRKSLAEALARAERAEAERDAARAENATLRQGVITEADYDARTMRVSYSTGDSRVTICATLGEYLDAGGTLAAWTKGGAQ